MTTLEILSFVGIGCLGIVAHLLTKWTKKATMLKNWKAEIPGTALSLTIVLAVVWIGEDMAGVFSLTKFTMFLLGYTAKSQMREWAGGILKKKEIDNDN